MQRNPLAAALSCIAAVLLIGVITATTTGYLSAKRGERRESALRQSEQEQRLREAEQRGRAEAALQVAMESLEELFAQIESNRRALRRMGDLHRSLHEYEAAESALLEAIASVDRLIGETPEETELHIQHARADYTLGRVYRDMGRRDAGDTLIQLAITELENLPNDAPQRRHIQELLSRFRRDVPRVPGE